ncbi:MAG: hypothetical protein OXF27_10105 [Acidobacteria bacterium]|nr:hypothetical protein [Acidobacteriota bacterium]
MNRLARESASFAVTVAHSIAAGVILALMFFAWREFVFPVPTVSGPWYCLTQTTNSDLSDYEDLFLGWRVVLAQSDAGIAGSSEKVWEHGRGRLVGDQIDRGDVGGFLQYNYLATSRLSVHVDIIPRHTRASTAFYDLRVLGDGLRGTFYWTSANQRGELVCQRELIDWNNEHVREQLLVQ